MMLTKYELRANLPPLPEDYPISAKVIQDSYFDGKRLTTFEIVFPRYILAEFNTHRALSKNTSSSRAIPTSKQIEACLNAPVLPVRFGLNQKGMSPSDSNLTGEDLDEARQIWIDMVKFVAKGCSRLAELGLHKQWASRPLEWATTTKMVFSASQLDNFFLLRDHDDAQDEIAYLAQAVKTALNGSTPRELRCGQWHLPYIMPEDKVNFTLGECLKISAARCARTSYKTQLGVTSTLEDDLAMFDKLTYGMKFDEDNPFHASPTEHQATPIYPTMINTQMGKGNMPGWSQLRTSIELNIMDKIPGSNTGNWDF